MTNKVTRGNDVTRGLSQGAKAWLKGPRISSQKLIHNRLFHKYRK